jgi:Phytanoyl-CoA dioxygenase (PhyH)
MNLFLKSGFNKMHPTYDCPPTLNDTQVLDFCKNGFLLLESVVPDEINQRATAYLDAHPGPEPSEILHEDWFFENVIANSQAAGAVRSLLGANFGLPVLMSNHRNQGPFAEQNWHRDGGSIYGPELNYLQVFYYPQDTPRETGPTELLPGSHFMFMLSNQMGHYHGIRGGVKAIAPAGSIFLTVYSIWHRRSNATAHTLRNLLKYNYFRLTPPKRDWVIEPDFDFATADYSLPYPYSLMREQFRECNDTARMFYWLSGESEEFRLIGGQGWPIAHHWDNGRKPYGFPTVHPKIE